MNNTVTKYFVANKQIRLYLLSGKQIYRDTMTLETSESGKIFLRKALNITALSNALNAGKQRISYTFLSQNRKSKITTESFSNGKVTGIVRLDETDIDFKGGTLQTISSSSSQFGSAYTSHSVLNYGELYQDMEHYYVLSEQTPTYFIPISEVDNPENSLLLVQPLPFANEKAVSNILQQINGVQASLSDATVEKVSETLASALMEWQFLETVSVQYSCSCSKEMFIGIIFALSAEELRDIATKNESLAVTCSLCGKDYLFSAAGIASYVQ